MHWVKDGADIPLELVRAAHEGRLVFFCGAGVSQQAGLPGFAGLVDAVYEKLHRQRSVYPLEQKAFDEGNYDQVLANLEREFKNPKLVRERVADILQLPADADTRTHEALLKLATDAHGMCRLVTTNYDLCFSRHMGTSTRIDAAPRLPLPKPGRWNSIVHLHGFLDDCGPNKEELVLSSADFGSAYLVDGWATRFLRELFQHFIVLFVGYRAEDLVVRYMLQALAVSLAARGEDQRAFAFAEIEGDEKATKLSWEARGINPILYAKKDHSHEVLHHTLRTWADKVSRGLLGRKSIVAEYLGQQAPVERDEIVDQVVWALKDENGATARFLADQKASPSPRHWLTVLDQDKLLSLNGVPLVDDGRSALRSEVFHPVTWNLAQWLCRHLAEAEVLDWALAKGGCLNPRFRWLVRDALNKQAEAIPEDMKRAWTFLARPSIGIPSRWTGDAYALAKQIASGAWDLRLRYEVAVMLEPMFVLKRDALESDSYRLEIETTFADGADVAFVLDSIRKRPDRDSILASLLDDCTTCVKRAMEVQHYFGQASPDQDWTYVWLQSINPFSNPHHKPLIALACLGAECLDAASRTDPLLARSQVYHWKTINYPIFRRLACYALARPNLFTIEESLACILTNDLVMWHGGCHVELCLLLTHLWPSLEPEPSRILIQRVLNGPPTGFYGEGISAAAIEERADWAVAKRLDAIQRSGRPLPQKAEAVLSSLSLKYAPAAGVDSPKEEKALADLTTGEIAKRVAEGIGDRLLREQWTSMVSSEWQPSLTVLRDLAISGKWPTDVWSVVFDQAGVWAMNHPSRCADLIAILELMKVAPPEFITEIIHSLSQLVEFFPRVTDPEGIEIYWLVWGRTLSIAFSESTVEGKPQATPLDAMSTAPGRLTETLFEWIRQRSLTGKHEVPEQFWDRLRTVCDPQSARSRGPRSLAAMHLGWLFSRNREWTKLTLVPSFDWSNPEEAKAVWDGFLASQDFQSDLWAFLKESFLDTFDNTDKLAAEPARSLYQMFGRIVVHCPDWLTNHECQRIVTSAQHEGRQQIAWVFWQNLEAAEDRAGSLWRDRIGPWLEECWQPDEVLKQPETAENLIHMVLAAGDAFPEAVDTVEYRLMAPKRPDSVVFAISRTQLLERFPEATVKLLDLAIDRGQQFYKADLAGLLVKISEKWSGAMQNKRFLDLSDFAG
jgi:hypothetical protein